MESRLTKLEAMLNQGKINRRDFLTKVAALGLTVALAPGLQGTSAFAATPKKGGRFRIGITGGSVGDSLNPAVIETFMLHNISWQLRNNLVEVGPDGDLVPELAESWEPSRDAATWRFKLRRGIEFHNGKTLDAEDVIYSINLHRDEKSKSAAKSFVKLIKDIKADGPNTVVFTLDSGNVGFPSILTIVQMVIIPANTTDFTIGTGGYILKDFQPGVRALTKRNPNYWKPDRAHFDEVEVLAIADVVARTAALKNGTIDAMSECDLKTAHLLAKSPDLEITNLPSRVHHIFAMRCDKAPFDNLDARLAMKYAIDRQEIVKVTRGGYGTVGNDHPISPNMPYFNSKLAQRSYDPDKARYHLKKAGLSDYTFKLHVSEEPWREAVDSALLYQQHAAKAGIKIEVVREPSDGYWKNIWMQKDFCAARCSGRQTEDMVLTQFYSDGSNWNETYWKNERFNQLLKAARVELNEPERKEMYAEMQQILNDDGGALVLTFANLVDAVSKKVKFGKLSSQYALDGQRCSERWWFA
jgi:peptide/nickel transport system substrate-binding protein